MKLRIGNGVDFHKLQDGLPFTLGGIQLEHSKGPVGHSDADVLLHAICDALLGAANLGDIGKHFPDTDMAYKGIDSKVLLQRSHNLIKEKGYVVINMDATVCLEKPKIAPYLDKMKAAISGVTGIDINDISIKATTSEGMGFVGREEGVMAYATVLLSKF
ncbi:2-C-methyl-D-erythritol 2,4-cyclodiphosphate synthase [Taibaiella sp. KBW10]|uniref:2-C-methyl-D-erythritol 2,4-cyclodiphosphate synthase n=1 Tax=Taibaiella sp. KBW10 TaxID=2153357 RepID=UPI000F5B4B58|nr:2-C-methyl-D-erythritol 2,4-cyclodiphosphate synthase [Taibaiella sp. KBW10]RQO30719.1 2-C-methyl-D-erythritol 2,4-cyclodiphosphate synthase [Taibaiella sp. KBW10]